MNSDRPLSTTERRDFEAVDVPEPEATRPVADDSHSLLVADEEREDLRARWESIQAAFVDEPRSSVEEADRLVNQQIERLDALFRRERETLETTWNEGQEASTEALRQALRRYRAFFERLLEV